MVGQALLARQLRWRLGDYLLDCVTAGHASAIENTMKTYLNAEVERTEENEAFFQIAETLGIRFDGAQEFLGRSMIHFTILEGPAAQFSLVFNGKNPVTVETVRARIEEKELAVAA